MDASFLRDIAATPRPTGGAAIAAVRQRCAQVLGELGYEVRELPFSFSAFPGRFGTPLVGALALAVVSFAAHCGARGARLIPLAVLVGGGATLTVLGLWLARRGVLVLPIMRVSGMNIEATQSSDTRVWLCAHLDTKSQPVPTLMRAFGIGLQSAGAATTLALAMAAAIGLAADYAVWAAAALVTLAGSIPVVFSVAGARSPGALDNASGVATVLSAARQLKDMEGVGVLLTDAEELGLAGAQAWASSRPPAVVLNCDGVDDAGTVTIMQPAKAPVIVDAVQRASQDRGIPARVRGTPIGLLTDANAFATHGFPSVTFSRGSWASLARVHSIRDDLSRLDGRGIPEVATLMAATARRLASRATNP